MPEVDADLRVAGLIRGAQVQTPRRLIRQPGVLTEADRHRRVIAADTRRRRLNRQRPSLLDQPVRGATRAADRDIVPGVPVVIHRVQRRR